MFKVGILCSMLLSSGCAYVDVAVRKGADANDSAVQAAEFTLCHAASVGSIRRAFGARPEVWAELCNFGNGFRIGEE